MRNHIFRSERLRFNWQFGLSLILLFGIPRFWLVLGANRTGNYNFTSIIFLVMWFTPFILLTKGGRQLIGLKKTRKTGWLFLSFVLGILACVVVFYLGKFFYQETISNWFVYISNSYGAIPSEVHSGEGRHVYFLMFAAIAMTFSPIGEELLYRGLIHQSFVPKFGENNASIIDSLAFALVHLAHFGIVFDQGVWKFLVLPAILWMVMMYWLSRIFFYCKMRSGSILGAVLAHAGFNLAMTYFIFYHVL